MESFHPPDPIDPEQVPSRVFLCYIHLGVKVRGFEAVEARVGQALRPRAQGGLVDTEAEHALLAYFLESMLDTLCRLSPEREWAAGYDDALGRLSRAGSGSGDTPHRLCRALYAMLMGFGILPTLPAALPGLPALSDWQVKHLACGHGVPGPDSGSGSSSGGSDASMGGNGGRGRADSDYSGGDGDGPACEKPQQHNPRPDTPALPCLGPPAAVPGFSPHRIRAGAAGSHVSQPDTSYSDTLVGPAAAAAATVGGPPPPPPHPEPQLCRGCSDPLQNRGAYAYPYAGIDAFPPYHGHPQQQMYDGSPPLLPLPPPASPPASASAGPPRLYRSPGVCSPAPAVSVVDPRSAPRFHHRRHRSFFSSGDAGPYGAGPIAVPSGPTWM